LSAFECETKYEKLQGGKNPVSATYCKPLLEKEAFHRILRKRVGADFAAVAFFKSNVRCGRFTTAAKNQQGRKAVLRCTSEFTGAVKKDPTFI